MASTYKGDQDKLGSCESTKNTTSPHSLIKVIRTECLETKAPAFNTRVYFLGVCIYRSIVEEPQPISGKQNTNAIFSKSDKELIS